MTQEEFLSLLEFKNLPVPILVEQPAGGYLSNHTHDFEVNALVIDGDILININGNETFYQVGDMFHLEIMAPHSEKYGPLGVKYLVSRKK
jgi:quercetin dioxygenase-like cupin family protein